MPLSIPVVLALLLLALGPPGGVAAEPRGSSEGSLSPALLVSGQGTRLLEVDGRPMGVGQAELTPGVHAIRFESTATVEPVPGRRTRRVHEVCEARFRARAGAIFVLQQEVIASRGARSWHHQLSSFVYDEDRDRATGECVCRAAPPE